MNRIMKKTAVALTLTALLSTSVFASTGSFGAVAAAETEGFSIDEMLQYALEDERLAQAEYEAIMAEFDVSRPFSNIAKAEATHEAAVVGLYETRGLVVPDFDATQHVVLPDSLEDIYEVGVMAEIKNIAMYEKFLKEELDEDVRAVFEALKRGSESHLAAFQRAANGETGAGASNRNGLRDNKGNGNSGRGVGNEGSTGDAGRNRGNKSTARNGNKGNVSSVNRRNQSMTNCPIGE